MSTWTRFMDMHSGGGGKEKWLKIYIEAPEKEAKIIFFNRFGHNPDRVTCTCCGNDYSISEGDDLQQLTAFDRNCEYAWFDKNGKEVRRDKAWVSGKGFINGGSARYIERADPSRAKYVKMEGGTEFKYKPWSQWIKNPPTNVLIIKAKNIKATERVGEIPEEGYVWVGKRERK